MEDRNINSYFLGNKSVSIAMYQSKQEEVCKNFLNIFCGSH